MLYLYFLTVSKDVKEGNKEGSAQKMVRNAANLAARITVASGTRFAVASAMAEAIAQSEFLSKAVAQKLAGKMPVGVYLLQVYGFQQKSSYGSPGTESNRSKLLLDSLPSKAGDALLLR